MLCGGEANYINEREREIFFFYTMTRMNKENPDGQSLKVH